jgi:hypothetical protein
MANGLGLSAPLALAALSLGFLAVAPARAQFLQSPYPTILAVPPPPAQNMVMPRTPKPQRAPPAEAAPPPDTPPHVLTCHYQGRTRVCE